MSTFLSFIKQHTFPFPRQVRGVLSQPLTWPGFLLFTGISLSILTAYIFLLSVNHRFLVTIPVRGGSLTEGVIGSPLYINPLLASTESDRGLVQLLYSGLMKDTQEGPVPDLAESYTVSPDSKTYTFILRPKIVFHDNQPLTAEDIVYTFTSAGDPTIAPLLHTYWQNVQVIAENERTVTFRIPQADTTFLSKLTLGILPAHLWSLPQDSVQQSFESNPLNSIPVGTGPFAYHDMSSTDGVINTVVLKRFPHFINQKPYLDTLRINFYANQTQLQSALQNKVIDMTMALEGPLISNVPKDYRIGSIPTDYDIILYRRSTETLLGDDRFVRILDRYIDKKAIIDSVENGYGLQENSDTPLSQEQALAELKKIGYVFQNGVLTTQGAPVGFAIVVEKQPDILQVARELSTQLGAIGMIVPVKAFDPGTVQIGVTSSDYQIVLGSPAELSIPPTYKKVLHLYTRTTPYITNQNVLGIDQILLIKPSVWHQLATNWYTEEDQVYPFIRTISNK